MDIPDDFPREPIDDFPRKPLIASIAGAQPKLPVRLDAETGKYVNTQRSEEVSERYFICNDLAEQLAEKCRRNRESRYAALSEVQILERLFSQLLGTDWGSRAEMAWIIRRTASVLGWSIPADATALRAMLGDSV